MFIYDPLPVKGSILMQYNVIRICRTMIDRLLMYSNSYKLMNCTYHLCRVSRSKVNTLNGINDGLFPNCSWSRWTRWNGAVAWAIPECTGPVRAAHLAVSAVRQVEMRTA